MARRKPIQRQQSYKHLSTLKNKPSKQKEQIQKTYILAVSGGPDSMYLLDTQARLQQLDGRNLLVAHVNYGLREGANEDELLVRQQAALRGITTHVYRVTPEERGARKGNLEAWARDLRYAYFEKLAKLHNAESVLTAHNANDQAETILMRLNSGTGLRGLAGMQSERGLIKRPLLNCTRIEILSYLEAHDIPAAHDPTNDDTTLTRNNVRHTILPRLEGKNPKIVKQLCDIALLAQEVKEDALRVRTQWLEKNSQWLRGELHVSKKELAKQPRLIRHEILRHITGLSGRQGKEEQELDRFLRESKNHSFRTLSNGLRVTKWRDTVAFRQALPEKAYVRRMAQVAATISKSSHERTQDVTRTREQFSKSIQQHVKQAERPTRSAKQGVRRAVPEPKTVIEDTKSIRRSFIRRLFRRIRQRQAERV